MLDVGCGDRFVAFGALEKLKTSKVILRDISQGLLNRGQVIAQEIGVLERCQFLFASADELTALDDASVDVVTTRSVLIFGSAKHRAFKEFHRVLGPNGRLSIVEPINRLGCPGPPHVFSGYDVTPVVDIAQRVGVVCRELQPPDTDAMLDFDERGLVAFAE